MVLGEGSWIYVLEEFEHAQKRGAKIYAEITGYGSTCDAYHRVRLQEGGDEPARAMSLAMADAGVDPSSIDYVNLHGTSTLLNDRIETNALKLALNCNAHRIPMSGTKSQVGHPQGASGAAGLGAALCAMHTGMIPPTINLDDPDPDCDLDYVPNKARRADVRVVDVETLLFVRMSVGTYTEDIVDGSRSRVWCAGRQRRRRPDRAMDRSEPRRPRPNSPAVA